MTPYDFQDGGFYLGAFPFFHLAGFFLACVYPSYSHSAAILMRPASRPPSPDLVCPKYELRGSVLIFAATRTDADVPSADFGIATLYH